MDITRSRRSMLHAVLFIVAGIAITVLGVYILLNANRIRIIAVGAMLIGGPLCAVVGFAMLLSRLWPLRLRIDERGVTMRREGRDVTIPWAAVQVIRVERAPHDDGDDPDDELWVYPVQGFRLGVEADHRPDGYVAYRLVDIDEIKEPFEQIEAYLRHFVGPRYVPR